MQLDNYIDDLRKDDSFKDLNNLVDLLIKLVENCIACDDICYIYILTLSLSMSVSRSVLFLFYGYAYHGCHETM